MLITAERHLQPDLSDYTDHHNMHPAPVAAAEPACRASHPSTETSSMRILRRDRLGGLIHEYAQVA